MSASGRHSTVAPSLHPGTAALTAQRLLTLCLIAYVGWLLVDYRYHFLDGANLLFHEAGHLVFGLLGQWPHFLGGSLGQLVFPALTAVYFLRRDQRFEAAVCGIWLGESCFYLAEYMADARDQALPLVGGHIHDWNWMLSRLGLLDACRTLAGFVRALASAWLLACLYGAWRWSAPVRPVLSPAETLAEKRRRRWSRR